MQPHLPTCTLRGPNHKTQLDTYFKLALSVTCVQSVREHATALVGHARVARWGCCQLSRPCAPQSPLPVAVRGWTLGSVNKSVDNVAPASCQLLGGHVIMLVAALPKAYVNSHCRTQMPPRALIAKHCSCGQQGWEREQSWPRRTHCKGTQGDPAGWPLRMRSPFA